MNSIRYYFDGKIIAPSKCGTKFLNDVFNYRKQDNVISLDQLDTLNFEWLIVRDPYEHLISAISTVYNTMDNKWSLEEILTKIINVKNVHWVYGFYKTLLFHGINHNFKIVELENLTNFIDYLKLLRPDYDDLHHKAPERKLNRKEILDTIENDFPDHMFILMNMVEDETKYYNLLLETYETYKRDDNIKRAVKLL